MLTTSKRFSWQIRSQNSKFASKTGFVFVSNTKHKYKKPKITTIFDHFHTKHNFSKHKTQRLSFSFVTKTTKHKTMFVFCTNTRVNTFVFCVFCVCTYENLEPHALQMSSSFECVALRQGVSDEQSLIEKRIFFGAVITTSLGRFSCLERAGTERFWQSRG